MDDVNCPECKESEFDQIDDGLMCMNCGYEMSAADMEAIAMYERYKIGVIRTVTPLKNAKLSKVTVDVGGDKDIVVVTNAKYVNCDDRVVVAMIGAIVPAGDADNGIVVKKTTVGGCGSHGMLCDAPMLGWRGTKGKLVTLSDEFAIGSSPPASSSSS